ncbi:MAG: cytidine deaminase [Ruthenibacterium sp.]
MNRQELIRAAFAARKFAYAPYSNFKVGAALLAKNGTIYTGCNIECATFSPTNCAERTALFKAVSEGVRTFEAIAIVGGKADGTDDGSIASPCGVCRQMLYEFAGDDLVVLMAKSETNFVEKTLGELLPFAFGKGESYKK